MGWKHERYLRKKDDNLQVISSKEKYSEKYTVHVKI